MMTTAERVAKLVAARNEIGKIPRIRHRRVRESCRNDLVRFGLIYCRTMLNHPPSDVMVERLVSKIQQCILTGGQIDVMCSRGLGKTTWMTIAITWAMLYGHRRFPVICAAKASMARMVMRSVWRLIESSDNIALDFPAVAIPIRALRGIAQRAAAQTYCGAPTGIITGQDKYGFPILTDRSGKLVDVGCGARMASIGVGGSVRGIQDMGSRPDLILFDDPQTQKDAGSPSSISRIDSFIHSDALNLVSHTSTLAAFVTITPQKFGDVAMRLSSTVDHPEWSVIKLPFVLEWGPKATSLIADYQQSYREDAARDDFARTISRKWYLDHRDDFAGTVVADQNSFDPKTEYDAIHHALNTRARVGEAAWLAEYMLDVGVADAEINITPDIVSHALTGAPEWVLPPGCNSAVGFVDVNIQSGMGLSWGVTAFGPARIASLIAYGRYPKAGPLVQPNSSDMAKKKAVATAIRVICEMLARQPLRMTDGNKRVQLRAVGFDRGYLPDVVCRTLYVLRNKAKLPFQVCAVRGYGWQNFGLGRKDHIGMGDHVFVTRSEFGEYLAVHAPYWREVMQAGFLETPLMPGSTSVYGSDSVRHYDLSVEVCNERLLRKYIHPSGKLAWDWATTGANHFCDVLSGCFAIGSWFRCYEALPRAIDAAVTHKAATEQMSLFDPMQNPAINDNAGLAPWERSDYDEKLVTPENPLGLKIPSLTAPKVETINKQSQPILRRRSVSSQWRKSKWVK